MGLEIFKTLTELFITKGLNESLREVLAEERRLKNEPLAQFDPPFPHVEGREGPRGFGTVKFEPPFPPPKR